MVYIGSNSETLKKGSKAPKFHLKATDNKKHTLNSLKGGKATLIVFMCNHCPYVKAKLDELNRIAEHFNEKGLKVIGINSNDPTDYPEDSFEEMRVLTKMEKVEFPYLVDESQDIAKAYGAVCTPDPFLFDQNLHLVFHSRIDNKHGSPDGNHELYDAIARFLKTGDPGIKETPSMGCSIKWRY